MGEQNVTKRDKVEWKSHGQNVKLTLEEKITDDTLRPDKLMTGETFQ